MTGSPANQGPIVPQGSDDEIHILDYWNILVQRRMVVLACLGLVIAIGMVSTFLAIPQYTATTTVEIERQGPEILEFTDVLGADPAGYNDFYQTQYKILQSRTVAELTVERLDLANRPAFATRKGSPLGRFYRWGRSLISGETGSDDGTRAAVDFIQDHLAVSPVRNSHLVKVSFDDRDPQLAAEVANAVAAAYHQFQLDARYTTTADAKDFLTRDVARVQGDIDNLEKTLLEIARDKNIVALGGKQDAGDQALSNIIETLTDARSRLAAAEAKHRAVQNAPAVALPEVMKSPIVSHLRQQHAELERSYNKMAERFNRDWPPLIQLRQELDTAKAQLDEETRNIAGQVQAVALVEYERLQAEVEALDRAREKQLAEVQRANLDAIAYGSLKNEIETKRKVLNNLVARQSETETSFRLKDSGTSNMRVVDEATPPQAPTRPRKAFNLVISILLGGALGAGMAFLFHHLDNTVKNEQDIQRFGNLSVLGHVPLNRSLRLVPEKGNAQPGGTAHLDLASHLDPRSSFSETFRNLRTSLLLASPDRPPRHVVITSCEPGDGKSTVALNLAIVLTQLGRRVLLVDADLRRPRVHEALQIPNAVGLSSFLSGNNPLEELLQETEVPNLRVISSGPIPPNPSELLGSPGLLTMLERFESEDRFDHVIFDSPPLLSVTDSTVLSSRMDTTILVVRAGVSSREALAQAAAQLRQARGNVSGAVLNAVSEEAGYYYGRYRGHGRYYRHSYRYPQDDDTSAGKSAKPSKGKARRWRAG